ncbi:DgyrCDS4852 [Dimorphilus gyrociliatus]|uniref:Nuclear cap-binding protein subunit 1 n=1 Tax=Dimorphilus gyrociliatus TaxID=2664684 RepID=A0A7I8VJM3_9ANNE|nr:DgyrCDS4852 [Dimorphilus gyrociliatus]
MKRKRYSSRDEVSAYARQRNDSEASETQDVEERLNNLIMKIGEKSTATLESNLLALSKVLHSDMTEHKDEILGILADCVVEMPEKGTVYSTLVGLINANSYSVGGEMLELLLRRLKTCMQDQQWESSRCIVRFISDLVNCHVLSAASLLAFLKVWIDMANTEAITSQVYRDMLVYYVMSSIPWVGRALYEKKERDFIILLKSIRFYLNGRSKEHLKILRVWSTNEPHAQEDYLDCLWSQIEHLENNDWMEASIIRPYEAFDSILCEALQHTLPNFTLPSYNDNVIYPVPKVVFRLFDYTDVPHDGPVLPGAHAVERYIIEEQLSYIIDLLYLDKKGCATALSEFTCRSRAPINYLIVEVIFSKLFELPKNKRIEIFYSTLLIELCKLQPSSFPLVLAQATELLFERLDNMEVTCVVRFATWFSHHLSNFQFRWCWDDWITDAECNDKDTKKSRFLKEVLIRCMKLSYHQRVIDFTPDSLEKYRPPQPKPQFDYSDNELSKKLVAAIKGKVGPEEIIDILEETPSTMEGIEEKDICEHNKLQVFVSTLLNLGSKSISHSLAALTKFHEVLRALADSEESQLCILNAVHNLWRNNEQMISLIIDKLVKIQIIDATTITSWIFSEEMEANFTCFYVWDVLHTTINRVEQQVANLNERYIQGKKNRNSFNLLEDVSIHDIPTSGQLKEFEDELETGKTNLKNLFLIIFQRFIICLGEHLSESDLDQENHLTPWYCWAIGRLKEIFQLYQPVIQIYSKTLEELIFTSEVDSKIVDIFYQFLSLQS